MRNPGGDAMKGDIGKPIDRLAKVTGSGTHAISIEVARAVHAVIHARAS